MEAPSVVVLKLNLQGKETWRYSGRILERSPHFVRLEAFFNREDTPVQGLLLRRGDRFVETYYVDRWYNIYEIYDRQTHDLKGWYCNVSRPAEIQDGVISYVDLALDLLVYPDGRQTVLDEDEFEALALGDEDQFCAREALRELQQLFQRPLNQRSKGETSPGAG